MKELPGFTQNMHFPKTLGVCRYNRQGTEVRRRAEASSGQCHADRVEDKRQFKAQSHFHLEWKVKEKDCLPASQTKVKSQK